MLSIHKIESAENAKHYFGKDNYYTKDGALENSYWYGKGADKLELKGYVHPDNFFELLSGETKDMRLGRFVDGERVHTPGWDCTFSAPKSVSILSEAFGMEEIRKAHTDSVKNALDFIQAQCSVTRRKVDGLMTAETTGNLCIAAFTHDTSRELDPQLHTHCIVANATHTDDGWRSLDSRNLFQLKMTAGRFYRNELARRLNKLGYTVEITGKNGLFEIAGFDKTLLDQFSTRRIQIEQYLVDNNLPNTPSNCELAALNTRVAKKDVDRSKLHDTWKKKLGALDLEAGDFQTPGVILSPSAKTIVRRAVRLLSEHDMAFSTDQILNLCCETNLGNTSSRSILKEIDRLKTIGHLLDADNDLVTTKQGVDLERQIIRNLHNSFGVLSPLADAAKIGRLLKGSWLNEDQLGAIKHCLSSEHRFIGIQGNAGTGKTSALSELVKILKRYGKNVLAVAPTHTAVGELKKSLDCPTQTLDTFLHSKKDSSKESPVWIVDEASFMSAKKMDRLQRQAISANARVILVGDFRQLESIEAGRVFKMLQDAGMETAVISRNMRQKDEALFDSVTHMVKDQFDKALDRISSSITEIDSSEGRISAMVNDWLSLDKPERDKTQMLAPSNVERIAANNLAHHLLIETGDLKKRSVKIQTYENKPISSIQSRQTTSYVPGDVLRFARDYKATSKKAQNSISKDEYYSVVAIDNKTNTLHLRSNDDGRSFTLNPNKRGGNRVGGISTFKISTLEVNIGESLRWTDNKNNLGIKRNHTLTVEDIVNDKLIVTDEADNKRVLNLNAAQHRHFTYNYVNTVYQSQGKTCDNVLSLADSSQLNLINRKSFYVTVSRARHSAKIYTDNRERLSDAIGSRFGHNTVALKQEHVKSLAENRIRVNSHLL